MLLACPSKYDATLSVWHAGDMCLHQTGLHSVKGHVTISYNKVNVGNILTEKRNCA